MFNFAFQFGSESALSVADGDTIAITQLDKDTVDYSFDLDSLNNDATPWYVTTDDRKADKYILEIQAGNNLIKVGRKVLAQNETKNNKTQYSYEEYGLTDKLKVDEVYYSNGTTLTDATDITVTVNFADNVAVDARDGSHTDAQLVYDSNTKKYTYTTDTYVVGYTATSANGNGTAAINLLDYPTEEKISGDFCTIEGLASDLKLVNTGYYTYDIYKNATYYAADDQEVTNGTKTVNDIKNGTSNLYLTVLDTDYDSNRAKCLFHVGFGAYRPCQTEHQRRCQRGLHQTARRLL